jgi:hypothetical protein
MADQCYAETLRLPNGIHHRDLAVEHVTLHVQPLGLLEQAGMWSGARTVAGAAARSRTYMSMSRAIPWRLCPGYDSSSAATPRESRSIAAHACDVQSNAAVPCDVHV